jgi:DNA-binding SARP family transcriptional activator
VEFRLLGPLEVLDDDGAPLAVGNGRQRALLALLVLRANELLTSDRLIADLWGDTPPATAPKMVHNQVSALRRVLNGRLETVGGSYRLNVSLEERDVDRFEALVARGALREALDLWRGPPLADLAFEPYAQTDIARLEERRWAAFEAWAEAELAHGRHTDLIAELEAAVAAQPESPSRPDRWGGYRLVPDAYEFWRHRDDRLHERQAFRRTSEGGWQVLLLQP